MNFMTCTTCHRVVQVNCTGICMSCQAGFRNMPSEDALLTPDEQVDALLKRKKEVEDALQESEAKSVSVCDKARDGKRVGSRNPKRKKAARKSKKKKNALKKEEVNLPEGFGEVK